MEESGLNYEWQTTRSKHRVTNSVHLALSMLIAIDDGSAHLGLSVTVQSLLAQHGDERGEEGSGQSGVKGRLDVDDSGIRTSQLRDSGAIANCNIP